VFQSAGEYELILIIEDNVILKLFYNIIYARDSTKALWLDFTYFLTNNCFSRNIRFHYCKSVAIWCCSSQS